MASYSDIFGTGAMPTFNIGPGHGNTSWKYGGDESAAIMDEHLAQRAADYADQKAFFQDTTMPALKDMFNPDEPEKDPLEAYLEEEAAARAAEEEAAALALAGAAPDTGPSGIDEDTGKFDGSPRAEDIRYSWGDMFNPDFYTGKDEANLWSGIADTAKKGANWIRENPWDATAGILMTNPYTGLFGYGMTREAIPTAADAVTYGSDSSKHFGKAMDDSEFFQSDLFMHEGDQPGSIERQREINKLDRNMDIDVEDYPYWYREDDHHGSIAGRYVDERGFEDGGRVGMNTGGLLPWTQTMSSDYANQYYNQFNNPTFGATTATQATTPTQSDTPTDLGDLGTIVPTTVALSGGLAQQRGRGPEDRGTWDQRFGQDNQYNRPGVHQGVAYESDDDGTLRASYVPSNMTSMSVGDLAPGIVQSVYNVGQLVPKTTGFIADLLGFGKDKDDKEAKAVEQAALQKELQAQRAIEDQIEQNRIASALAAQQELAAINSGGDGSDSDNTTQTSTSTGSGGSPLAGGVSLGTSLHGGNQYTGGGSHGGGPHSGGQGRQDRDRNRRGCFVKGTMIQMADGTEKEITTIEVGEETKGGQVQAKMEFLPERIYDYKGVKVSGSHWVIEDDQFIEVDNSKHGVLTDRLETVYCFKTSDNRIWIKDIEFGDFETGSDADWEPHFEMVKQKLNKELREKRL